MTVLAPSVLLSPEELWKSLFDRMCERIALGGALEAPDTEREEALVTD